MNSPTMRQFWLLRGLALLCVLWGTLPSAYAQQRDVPAQQSSTQRRIFLPFLSGGAASGEPVDPQPDPVGGAIFMEPDKKTSSAGVAVDAQGGLHVAYGYSVPLNEAPQAVYLYCPGPASACTDPNRWNGVALADRIKEVQLQLTPSGQPRLLLRSDRADGRGDDFAYAACDANCTSPESWARSYLLSSDGTAIHDISDYTQPQRSFALDPQGRPRFVYFDRNYSIEPDHYGVYYVWCDADCTVGENWSQARISRERKGDYLYDYESFEYPSLAFTWAGQPRIAASVIPLAGEDGERETGLYYLACDASCDDEESWERVKLAERESGTTPTWDIALDAQDRPRIAFYQGGNLAGTGKRLHYLSCATDCLSTQGWRDLNLGLESQTGEGADIALDAQGRPRIAYVQGATSDLGYSWCDSACEAATSWQHVTVEQGESLEQAYPVARPVTCDAGFWQMKAPVLALDAAGSPRIAYDAAYQARCLCDDPTDSAPPYYRFHQLWHSVRATFFPQP